MLNVPGAGRARAHAQHAHRDDPDEEEERASSPALRLYSSPSEATASLRALLFANYECCKTKYNNRRRPPSSEAPTPAWTSRSSAAALFVFLGLFRDSIGYISFGQFSTPEMLKKKGTGGGGGGIFIFYILAFGIS